VGPAAIPIGLAVAGTIAQNVQNKAANKANLIAQQGAKESVASAYGGAQQQMAPWLRPGQTGQIQRPTGNYAANLNPAMIAQLVTGGGPTAGAPTSPAAPAAGAGSGANLTPQQIAQFITGSQPGRTMHPGRTMQPPFIRVNPPQPGRMTPPFTAFPGRVTPFSRLQVSPAQMARLIAV